MSIHTNDEYDSSFYGAVQCTDKQYFSDSGINCSGLKTIKQKSPYHFHMYDKINFNKDTEALRIGTLIHALVLGTPHISEFGVFDGASKNSVKYREWIEKQPEGQTVVLERELEFARKIYKHAYEQNDLIRMIKEKSHHFEIAAFHDRLGYRTKAKADALYFPEEGDGIIWDLKTTNDLFKFDRDARNYGYHMQDVWYREIFQSALKRRFDYRLIVVEKSYPYSVVEYSFSDRVLDQGKRWIDEAFGKYCVGFDTGVWSKPETNILLDWRY